MAQQEKKVDDELLQEMIEKEAYIEKVKTERGNDQKQIQHIQQSNTWRWMKPFRKIKDFFTKLFGSEKKRLQDDYIHQLEHQVENLEDELSEAKDQLQSNMLDSKKLDNQQLIDQLREKKQDGSLIRFIDETIKQRKQHVSHYNEALIYAARLFMNERTDKKNLVYSKILQALNREEIPEFMMRAGLDEEEPLALSQVNSFRGSLSERVRKQQQVDLLPEYTLEDKLAAYDFADQLGIRRPEATEGTFSLQDLPKREKTVIKPADGAGSRGVYLIYAFNDIIDMKRSRKLTSLLELEENMQKDLTLGWVEEDQWLAEELILENKEEKRPATDVKFYCFYGKVGLILEISRYPDRKHCWWTATGERIRTGKYEEALFKGAGVTNEELELAEKMSRQVPAPFIRIDFLRSEEGLVLGEFTAKPGNYDEFDDETDEWLGDYFSEAEGQLIHDLLADKKFATYKSFIEKQGYSITNKQQAEPTQ